MPLDLTVPDRRQICDLKVLIHRVQNETRKRPRSMVAKSLQETILIDAFEERPLENAGAGLLREISSTTAMRIEPAVERLDEIIDEISANVVLTVETETFVPSGLQDNLRQAIDQEQESEGDDWPLGPEEESPFLTRRHPDLTIMCKQYGSVQDRLVIFLGSALGILGARFGDIVIQPLLYSDSLWSAILVAVMLASAITMIKIYAQCFVIRKRLEEWVILIVSVAFCVGAISLTVQHFGLLMDSMVLGTIDLAICKLDVILAFDTLLTIYYMVRGARCYRCYTEAMAAALSDAEEVDDDFATVELVKRETNAGLNPPSKASSLSLRWILNRMRQLEQDRGRIERAA